MRTVLFVCTGNTCRSPMAEAIARQAILSDPAIAGDESEVFIASAGISALDGMPTTRETVEALRRKGIAFDGRSKRLTAQMIRKAHAVFTMTAAHRDAAQRLVEDSRSEQAKIVSLDPENDIEDPIGMGQQEYDALSDRLSKLIPLRLSQILRPEDSGKDTAPAESTPSPRSSASRRESTS